MPGGQEARILIVEDDDSAAAVQERLILERIPAIISRAHDCASARSELESHEFDMVLLDYRLPDESGFALLEEIASAQGAPAVVVVTGRGDEQKAAEAFRLGASCYVVKDSSLSFILPKAVDDALAKNALKRSERLIQALVENSSVIFSVLDREGCIVYMSPGITALSGFTREELQGMNAFDLVHPDDRKRTIATFAQAITEPGVSVGMEYRIRHKNGTWRTLECHGENLLEDPNVRGAVITTKDVTSRKEIEDALRQSREMYKTLLDTTHDSFFLTDMDGVIQEVSQRALELFAYDDPSDLVGNNLGMLTASEDRKRAANDVLNMKLSGASLGRGMEYRMQKKNGEPFAVEMRFAVVPGDDLGNGIVMFAMTDITERRRAEDALKESEERYRELFEETPAPLWEDDCSGIKACLDEYEDRGIVDISEFLAKNPEEIIRLAREVKVVDVNQATVDLFEAKDKAEISERYFEIFTADSFESVEQALVRLATGGELFKTDTSARTLKGKPLKISVRGTIAPGHEETLSRVLFSVLDITELQRVEDKLRKINAELEAYAHTVSHDLKGPLSAVIGYGDVLKMAVKDVTDKETREKLEEYLHGLETSARRCYRLIEDLLDLAQAGQTPKDIEHVDVGQLVQRIWNERQVEVETGNIELVMDEDLGCVYANPTHVYQLFANLITNAISYNDCEKALIEVRRLEGEEKGVHHFLLRDNGRGLPMWSTEDVFLPFRKSSAGGTGIGLYIVAKIVETYGGEISAYNDDGACFKFSLRDVSF